MNQIKISTQALETPVLLIAFNRPDTTRRVFEVIRNAKPRRLYLAADGPRADKAGEQQKVTEVRKIVTAVDWPCEVKLLFRENNLGCKNAVSSAITWFFENEEQGIILEDDCLPHQSFFRFCGDLLERYKDEERVAMISGNNFQFGKKRGEASYYFSRYASTWGWATWRRSWQYFDMDMKFWPAWKASTDWKANFPNWIERKNTAAKFESTFDGTINAWDYQWSAVIRKNKALVLTPGVNLVSNIGFGEDATNTSLSNHLLANLPTKAIQQNIIHPNEIVPSLEADRFWSLYQTINFISSLPKVIKKALTFFLT